MGQAASMEDEVLMDEDEPSTSKPLSSEKESKPARNKADSLNENAVNVSQTGFSSPEITIMEGQVVTFVWDDSHSNLDILQVIHDGENLRPVIGGYSARADQSDGQHEQQFNLEGEYKFAIKGIRCTPLTVIVKRRVDLLQKIVNEGFEQDVVHIEQGHSIKWQWTELQQPHSVQEVTYVFEKACFKKDADNSSGVVKTLSGNHRMSFPKPGLFFFQTETQDARKYSTCAVHVREAKREYKVEVLDRSFQPMILLIEEGDRVWWYWDKFKCKKPHLVYEIEAPSLDLDEDEPYKAVEGGFRWTTPSQQGLMAHDFYKPGVYFYSDQNAQEAAEYIGTIIVKPKQKEHFVHLTENGFNNDVVYAGTGDRLWFHWDKDSALKNKQAFCIKEEEKCINPRGKPQPPINARDIYDLDDKNVKLCTKAGVATSAFNTIGVYHYRISNGPAEMNTCSVIVNPGSKNHTIHLTDQGFEPKVITVRPNDRVWWVWQSCKKPHNILQVSHQGNPIAGGFQSGMARDAPSAYVNQFSEPGVFYFISENIKKVFGAILVSTQPQVHEIMVSQTSSKQQTKAIKPDPMVVKKDDIVCWNLKNPGTYDVVAVNNIEQVLSGASLSGKEILPRRIMQRAVLDPGVFHYYSKSFLEAGDDGVRFSSVICDDRYDNNTVRVDKDGFHPHFLYIVKGESVQWTWKGQDKEAHNIIHVTGADSQTPLNIIGGSKSFNSGKPVPNNSFLYTFDETGSYTVASQGAPGYSCTIFVEERVPRVDQPYMKKDGGQVTADTELELFCKTPGAKIYYTTDGSPPELHLDAAKLYKPEKKIHLRGKKGVAFVRALAVLEGYLTSHIFTSNRFFIPGGGEEQGSDDRSSVTSSEVEEPRKDKHKDKSWSWWDCAPRIMACFTSPGIIEVFWEKPEPELLNLVESYQVFLNGVSYCDEFPATNNSLNISGLAGGRKYRIFVECYAKDKKMKSIVSNSLVMTCPIQTPEGGPVISLEQSSKKDELIVVWMSVDSPKLPIAGYLVFLDDVQCGQMLVPDPESSRCKVVIGSCTLDQPHRVYVKALPTADMSDERCSNVLEMTLPLDYDSIELHPEEQQKRQHSQEQISDEYLEIHEGAGYLPAMKDEGSTSRTTGTVIDVEGPNRLKGSSVSSRGPKKKAINYNQEGVDYREFRRGTSRRLAQDESASSYSESEESETETESEESETSETDTIATEGTTAVISAQKAPQDTQLRTVKRSQETYQSAREVVVDRVGSSQRQRQIAPRGEDDEQVKIYKHSRGANAVIQVQQDVHLDEQEYDRKGHVEKTVGVVASKELVNVKEGQFVDKDNPGQLAAPSIMVRSHGHSSVSVHWMLNQDLVDEDFNLLLFVLNIVGTGFEHNIQSDHSFECNLVEDMDNKKVKRGVQHCWNVRVQPGSHKYHQRIDGLQPGKTYRIFVIANYTTLHGNQPSDIQTTSSVIRYTTMGPPQPPMLYVHSVDENMVTMNWDRPSNLEPKSLKAFNFYRNHKLYKQLDPNVKEVIFKDLIPGKTEEVCLEAVSTIHDIKSDKSRKVCITCPKRPYAPDISNQPSYRPGCVLIGWSRPKVNGSTYDGDQITQYRIFVNDKLRETISKDRMKDTQGYRYYINDLEPGRSYDVYVRSVAGSRNISRTESHVYCLCTSDKSNVLTIQAPAAPSSPDLKLDGMGPKGIDVTWQIPQQHGDVSISGYQMLRDGKIYGGVIPPDVCTFHLSDAVLGDRVSLRLIALTEHPIGKMEKEIANRNQQGTSSTDKSDVETFLGDHYAGCRPGAELTVHFRGLVKAPPKVWCEQITGHSALIVWEKDDEPRPHYLTPDQYHVTWWPGDRAEDNIKSEGTRDDHLLITDLKADTAYTVVVEARKMEKYSDVKDDQPASARGYTFIISDKSDHLKIRTARPPSKPSNIGVSATTCNSLRVEWNQNMERGVDIVAMRVEAIAHNTREPHYVSYDCLPDARSCDVENLKEKTEYIVRVTAITGEFFDRLPDKDKMKKMRMLPKTDKINPDMSPWLPNDYIICRTAGTEPPANLRVVTATTTSVLISWIPPIVYGSNQLTNIIVRWADVRHSKKGEDEVQMSSYKMLDPRDTRYEIRDLTSGTQYKIVVEAVVSIKTSLETAQDVSSYRRTAHVMSKPLYTRARAPTEAPRLYVVEYSQSTALLYWEKPKLVTKIGKDEDGNTRYLRRYLEGYKLEINGATHCCLGPASNSCTLKKCRPGKEYIVTLVALTCTDDGRRERKRKFKGFYNQSEDADYATFLDDEDNLDHSPSEPVTLVLPRTQQGNLESMKVAFVHNEDKECNMFGDLKLSWTLQGESNLVSGFNVKYMVLDDQTVQQVRSASAGARSMKIPVDRLKCTYDITIEPQYYTETLPQKFQNVQCVIPGPPDAPEIFTKSVSPEEFVIEWGEPLLYGGVKVRGYQVYLNDKKAGNELSNTHRKAVIPCKPNRTYRVNIVALSSKPEFEDSLKSNTLTICTSLHSPRQQAALDDWTQEEADIPVKVAQVTDTSIHLDWSRYLEVEEVSGYRIEWSSVAQPTQRSLNLERDNNSCIINNCLPGTTHFIRLLALDSQGKELERSRQITIQTSAPPEPPVIHLRACNFRYIAIQWDKPTTYGDALVTGYKVFVNGIIQHTLNADQLSYTYTDGKWSHEYTFQVQALTASERLYSQVSEPLTVTWPGARSPHLYRLPTNSSSVVKVAWDDISLTDGVKIKHFRGICAEEASEKVVHNIPIHPESREVEFPNLKNKAYNIYLEVHLYGTNDVVRSEILHVQPAPSPDPPRVTVTVVGLEERRQLDRITCDLVNKRDRLIRQVGHKLKEIGALAHPIRAEKNRDVIQGAHTLTRVEELLEKCFVALEHFTGHLIAHVSWHCPQTNPDFMLSGYKLLIDGKQYGSPMHEGVKTIRINLPVEQSRYRLSMVSMTDRPQATSSESNSVELISEIFQPFAFYCYHSIHSKDMRWPHQGCCKYQDSIMYERQLAKKLANQGLLKKRVPPPACSVLDMFDGEYKPLMSTHNKQFPTALLFWTPWCKSSQKMVNNFVRFAKENSSEFNFIAVTCGLESLGANERKALIHQITSCGWRAEGSVVHYTSQCASNIQDESGIGPKNVDLTEILGIAGVPTLLFVHPDGYITWHGRYCAIDYAAFAGFMKHTFHEVLGTPCSVFRCDCCQNDITIDDDAIEPVLQMVSDMPIRSLPYKGPPEICPSEPDNRISEEALIHQAFFRRRPSPKGKRGKRKSQLTVSQRPYSASTYVQLLKSPYMQQVVPSPKVLNRLLRPASASRARYT